MAVPLLLFAVRPKFSVVVKRRFASIFRVEEAEQDMKQEGICFHAGFFLGLSFDQEDGMVWTGSIWLRTGTSGGFL
jgi:hypothetical protein